MEDTRKCGKCHQEKELTPENWKAKFRGGGLQVASNCQACADRDKIAARERRAAKNPDKENTSAEADASARPDPEDASEFLGVTPITLDEFCDALDAAGNISLFSACVDTSALDLDMEDIKAAADSLADIVWEKTGYRFQCISHQYLHCLLTVLYKLSFNPRVQKFIRLPLRISLCAARQPPPQI
jgi:hypothetical protein